MRSKVNNLFICLVSMIACLLIASDLAQAAEGSGSVNANLLGKILDVFYSKTDAWASIFKGYALSLFKYLLIIDVAIFGFRKVVKKSSLDETIAEAVWLFFPASVMLVFLLNYKEWAKATVNEFLKIGNAAGYSQNVINPSSFLQSGCTMAQKLWDQTSMMDPASWGMLIAGFIIIACFGLMAARVIQITCEYYIVMNAGMVILGLGASTYTRNYAINVLKFVFSVAAKLFVLQLLLGLCLSFVDDMMAIAPTLEGAAVMIGVALVMAVLANTIPDIMGGVINGANVSTGNALGNMVTAAAASIVAAAAMMPGAMDKAGRVVGGAVGAAKAEGHSGVANLARESAKNVAKSIAGAYMDRPMDQRSFSDRMRSNLSAKKQTAKLANADDGSSN